MTRVSGAAVVLCPVLRILMKSVKMSPRGSDDGALFRPFPHECGLQRYP